MYVTFFLINQCIYVQIGLYIWYNPTEIYTTQNNKTRAQRLKRKFLKAQNVQKALPTLIILFFVPINLNG